MAYQIDWKTLKYGHYKKAKKLYRALIPPEGEAGAAYDEDEALDQVVLFTIELIESWNFVDEDTGEMLPVAPESMDQLSLDQFKALFNLFSRKFGLVGISLGDADEAAQPDEIEAEVPKESA